MSDTAFGFLVSIIAIFVLIIFISVLFGPGHSVFLNWLNAAFQSGAKTRTEIGL